MKALFISDKHCGHLCGLTPPGWWLTENNDLEYFKQNKFATLQREVWNWFEGAIASYGPFDCVVVNGDSIDGSGHRSGGTEQATLDRLHQCEIAEVCIRRTMSRRTKVFMTIGTAYHTGEAEDFETVVANNIGAEKIGAHEWIKIAGVIFDVKHHCGSSAVPHGRHTAVARERLWNVLWAERGQQPKAHVTIRSHVHYYSICGGVNWLGMTTPALQSHGTKYGARRCSGIVDVGMVVFDCNKGHYSWTPLICETPGLVANVIEV